jgi:ribose transport system substrate-binding protein
MAKLTLALLLGTQCIVLTACHSPGTGSGTAEKQLFVAFSQCNNAEPYRAAQNALMTEHWAQYPDVKLVIADAGQDDNKQISQIETFIRQKPDLLIVAPNERAPLTAVMGTAVQAGIPVICLERDILEPNYTTYISADNRDIGRMAEQFIVDYLSKKYERPQGNIVQIKGPLGVEAEIARNDGAHDVFVRYPSIRIVNDAVADWIQAKAKDRMVEALRANPHIDVVYAHNDPMAVGAYLAAHDLGREKEMIFVGVDGLGGPNGGIKKVMDGILAATFVYPLCVDKAVEIGNQMLRDKNFKPDKIYTLHSTMITPQNAADAYQKFTFLR